MAYKVITFDGGGICGLFSAALLDRLAAEVPGLVDDADLLAGTSTGGIIALCLAAGKKPADLVRLYGDNGRKIFDDSWFDNVLDLGTAIGADYDNSQLKKLLTRELGAVTLSKLGKRVLVPTFDLCAEASGDRPMTWKPKFFHNFPGNDSDGAELAVDIALRTSAAPTYFPAYQGFIDGGVVSNNPSMAALALALDKRAGKQSLEDVVLLSISTGSDAKFIKGESLDWGWGQWARPLVAIMINGVMGVADFQCQQLLGDNYRRLDTFFDRAVNLDDVKPKTLEYLKQQANAMPIGGVVNWLKSVWR
ncbi:MAG: patatin-like phospholipase family protein [Phycisphaerales bacterium]